MRPALAALLLLAACAHPPPARAPSEPAARICLPVRLTVTTAARATYDELIPLTERVAREQFEARGHPVRGDAEHSAELELVSIGGGAEANAYRFCVRVQGRMVRGEKRFAAVDVAKERCDDFGLASGAPHDLISVANAVRALSGGKDPDQARLMALYDAAVTDLVAALAGQATRPAD